MSNNSYNTDNGMECPELTQLWGHAEPDSLLNICVEFVVCNFKKVLLEKNRESNRDKYSIKPEVQFPISISDLIHRKSIEMRRPIKLKHFIQCYRDSTKFPCIRMDLTMYTMLTEEELSSLLSTSKPIQLCLDSDKLLFSVVDVINKSSENLLHLQLGMRCKNIFSKEPTQTNLGDVTSEGQVQDEVNVLSCPHLQSLATTTLCNAMAPQSPIALKIDLDVCADSLKILDLSNMAYIDGLYKVLSKLKRLQILSLHGMVKDMGSELTKVLLTIGSLSNLRSLDLGVSTEPHPVLFDGDVNEVMKKLVDGLPNLERLEICGTNLAGERLAFIRFSVRMRTGIKQPAIEYLKTRRLKYLGLLNCFDDACHREDIPADVVSGNSTIEQILVSLEAYEMRPELLLMALNSLFELVRGQQFPLEQQAKSLQLILNAMDKHTQNKDIQISGSASLFYIVKGNLKNFITTKIKKHMVRALLDAMEKNISIESNMTRNGCLIMCHFNLPQDLLHEYKRTIEVLLRIIEQPAQPTLELVQKISLMLINSMACQVDNEEKCLLGKLRSFDVMLKLIKYKISKNACDEVMEIAWSFMWNATDETPSNCQQFIEKGGLAIFNECLEKFPDKDELLRNMMGLLGNVAEVDFLREHLMQEKFISIFNQLLDSRKDGIEVSYNACGVLANILYDGPTMWRLVRPNRDEVRGKMVEAIQRWPIHVERNINYRSFIPILRLLDCHHTPEVQLWAVWALCNLTKVYRHKYCPILKRENGLDKLAELFQKTSDDGIKTLSAKVLRRCTRFINDPNTPSDDEGDDGGGDGGDVMAGGDDGGGGRGTGGNTRGGGEGDGDNNNNDNNNLDDVMDDDNDDVDDDIMEDDDDDDEGYGLDDDGDGGGGHGGLEGGGGGANDDMGDDVDGELFVAYRYDV